MIGSFITQLAIGAVIIAFAGGLYFYVQFLRADNARLLQNQTVLEDVIQAKDIELERKRQDFLMQTQSLNELEQVNQKSQQRISDLIQVLGDGRIGRIAKDRPAAIQRRINKANSKWNEEIRQLTDPSYEEENQETQ